MKHKSRVGSRYHSEIEDKRLHMLLMLEESTHTGNNKRVINRVVHMKAKGLKETT